MTFQRPSKDEYFLSMALLASSRSTCQRRKVGCVLTDKQGHVLSTGYNGVPKERPHCNEDTPCMGSHDISGQNLNECQAIHAEVNAIAHCRDVIAIHIAYVTTTPCMSCMKLLLATDCARIVAPSIYDKYALNMWIENGRSFTLISKGGDS